MDSVVVAELFECRACCKFLHVVTDDLGGRASEIDIFREEFGRIRPCLCGSRKKKIGAPRVNKGEDIVFTPEPLLFNMHEIQLN